MRDITLTGNRRPGQNLKDDCPIMLSCTATTGSLSVLETKIRLGVLRLREPGRNYRNELVRGVADLRLRAEEAGGTHALCMWIMSADKPLLRSLIPGAKVEGRL